MSDLFLQLRMRGNTAVAYALQEVRAAFHKNQLDAYQYGYARGQLIVAHCDLCADTYLVDGARNEINFLSRLGRKAH
jgi:hypothetical protein